jgi:two-component system, OmpR family, sensor kinase
VSALAAMRAGIRRRLMLATLVVTGVALVLGAAGGVLVLRQVLLTSTEDALTKAIKNSEAGLRSRSARQHGPADRIRWNPHQTVAVAQLVDSGGRVVAGSRPCPAVAALDPEPGHTARAQAGGLLVLAKKIELDGTRYTIVVGEPLRPVELAVRTVLGIAAVGVPLAVVLMGLVAHWLTGRALAPVERIREQVAAIGQADLARRVPEPPGGDEIARLATTMNGMLTRLQHAQRAQRRFVADAGHELRSPLTTITGILELIERDGGRADADSLHTAQSEARRLAALVANLLLLARSDDGGLALRRDEVDLDDVVEAERVRLRSTTDLVVEVSLASVKVRGDREALARLVRNLADNAARHGRTRIRLATTDAGTDAVLEVADDGPGVPAGERDRIFDRFVRLEDARDRSSGGTGLGLAIVRQIAQEHGGTVEVGAAPGGGALFRVRIPTYEPRPATIG